MPAGAERAPPERSRARHGCRCASRHEVSCWGMINLITKINLRPYVPRQTKLFFDKLFHARFSEFTHRRPDHRLFGYRPLLTTINLAETLSHRDSDTAPRTEGNDTDLMPSLHPARCRPHQTSDPPFTRRRDRSDPRGKK